jgi:DnaK suppressor protein
MPALSPDTARELRKRLDAARADILGHIQARRASPGEPPPVAPAAHLGQPDDMAQATYLGDNEMALLGQEQALLRDIDSALVRLEEGAANVCIVCGRDIPDEWLLAVPTVQTCVQCQQHIEMEEGRTRGPTM